MTIDHDTTIEHALTQRGFAFVSGSDMRALFVKTGALTDWDAFAASWNDLGLDTYMADGGRYRRRRHAVYRAQHGPIARQPNQPHFQTQNNNPLNGGIDRWFDPVDENIGAGASLQTILGWCHDCFGRLSPDVASWLIEVHQFRIEARAGAQGRPTPEGAHRDGVDWVLVLLIDRVNIQSGTTTVADLDKAPLGSFTLTTAFDAALVDDSRVYHGVTPVEPLDPALPAHRDVLVVTFRRNG